MSLRQVLTIYNAERQLTDDETALLNTLRTMTDAEREMISQSLSDKPQKKAGKKSASKSSGKSAKGRCQAELVSGATCNMVAWHGIHDAAQKDKYVESHEFLPAKSSRASGMASAISRSLESSRQATVASDDNEDDGRCTYKIGEDSGGPIICDTLVDNNVHHKQTDPDYHPFQSASHADGSSSASNAATSGTQNSGTQPEGATDAVHAASGGD